MCIQDILLVCIQNDSICISILVSTQPSYFKVCAIKDLSVLYNCSLFVFEFTLHGGQINQSVYFLDRSKSAISSLLIKNMMLQQLWLLCTPRVQLHPTHDLSQKSHHMTYLSKLYLLLSSVSLMSLLLQNVWISLSECRLLGTPKQSSLDLGKFFLFIFFL